MQCIWHGRMQLIGSVGPLRHGASAESQNSRVALLGASVVPKSEQHMPALGRQLHVLHHVRAGLAGCNDHTCMVVLGAPVGTSVR